MTAISHVQQCAGRMSMLSLQGTAEVHSFLFEFIPLLARFPWLSS